MGTKKILIGIILFAAVAGVFSIAEGARSKSISVAVVSVPEVLVQSKYADAEQKKVLVERDEFMKEMQKAKVQIDGLRAELETRKSGGDDYNNLRRQYFELKATAEVKKEFFQEELLVKQKNAMEALYLEMMDVIGEVAKEKGVEVVLDKGKLEIPAATAKELTLTIQTHKVLYSADHIDLTKDVIAKLDKKL